MILVEPGGISEVRVNPPEKKSPTLEKTNGRAIAFENIIYGSPNN
jgi:hypothetical protein